MNYQPEPIRVNPLVKTTHVMINNQCREPLDFGLQDSGLEIVARIRRAGTSQFLVEYPAHIVTEGPYAGTLRFNWGHTLYDLPSGRYVAEILAGEESIGRFQIQLNTEQWAAEPVYREENTASEWVCTDPCE